MSRCFLVPEITLDRSSLQTLRQQIHTQIADAIRHGALPAGARLPSSRLLAKLLHVSRNTVLDAFERLLEDNLLQAKAGSGIQVSATASASVPNLSSLRRIAWQAHYPVRILRFDDPDGAMLYLNATR